jgi:hydroxysqualene synthase
MSSQFGLSTSTYHSKGPGVNHYENFPVASWLCPARLRPAIAAIYWFARTADDLADEGDATMAKRLSDLAAYRANLHSCAKGYATLGRWSGLFDKLAPHIAQQHLPLSLLDDLLSAFMQDVQYTAAKHWYADHAELQQYCKLSANPVGRLLLHLYGVTDEAALAESDTICTALQLINFWQDAGRDIAHQRYYVPLDLMGQTNVTPMQLLECKDSEETMNLIAACTDIAWATMQKGLKLPARVQKQLGGFDGWRAGLELRCVIQGGLRILDKIRAIKHRTLGQRPKLNRWDACVVLWRALRM